MDVTAELEPANICKLLSWFPKFFLPRKINYAGSSLFLWLHVALNLGKVNADRGRGEKLVARRLMLDAWNGYERK